MERAHEPAAKRSWMRWQRCACSPLTCHCVECIGVTPDTRTTFGGVTYTKVEFCSGPGARPRRRDASRHRSRRGAFSRRSRLGDRVRHDAGARAEPPAPARAERALRDARRPPRSPWTGGLACRPGRGAGGFWGALRHRYPGEIANPHACWSWCSRRTLATAMVTSSTTLSTRGESCPGCRRCIARRTGPATPVLGSSAARRESISAWIDRDRDRDPGPKPPERTATPTPPSSSAWRPARTRRAWRRGCAPSTARWTASTPSTSLER